jgi:peptide subunit release factor 1 (eRF1)
VLPVRVEDYLAYEPHADVALLMEILDDYERYAVALVDRRHARLFSVFLGAIEEQRAFQDFVPGQDDRSGLSEPRKQHHLDTHVHWHLKHVARELADLHRRRPFDRLIIAGPEEAASGLRSVLPRALAHRVAAVIPGEMNATTQEILDRTLEVEQRVERDVEDRVVTEMFDKARAGGRATSGVAPTLEALWLNQVQTLVVAAGVHLPGSECTNCGRLEAGHVVTCPACGAPMGDTQDLFHRAVGRTIEQAGTAEIVHDDAARRLREAGGGLGALLRFGPL